MFSEENQTSSSRGILVGAGQNSKEDKTFAILGINVELLLKNVSVKGCFCSWKRHRVSPCWQYNDSIYSIFFLLYHLFYIDTKHMPWFGVYKL